MVGFSVWTRPPDRTGVAVAAMSDAPTLEALLSSATQAESKRDGQSLYDLAEVARRAGALALAL